MRVCVCLGERERQDRERQTERECVCECVCVREREREERREGGREGGIVDVPGGVRPLTGPCVCTCTETQMAPYSRICNAYGDACVRVRG
jgi:hypothetical protein